MKFIKILFFFSFISSQSLASDYLDLRLNVTDINGNESTANKNELVLDVNRIWDSCSIRFIPTFENETNINIIAETSHPQSQGDLGTIVSRFTIKNSIPLVLLAWDFIDKESKLYLYGLGWAFYFPTSIDRVGTIVNKNAKHMVPNYPVIIAHELGHALSLGHTDKNDIMGKVGSPQVRPEQCSQAREFILSKMSAFILK